MFIRRKTHIEIVSKLEQLIQTINKLHSDNCAVYERQIEDLKKLIFIPKQDPSPSHVEADNVISASEKPYEMSEEERTKMIEGVREFDRLLSGNYDQDFLN